MELHGVTGAPYQHPQVRKKLPAPFTRPSISVGGGARQVKRDWRDVSVVRLAEGDTVAGFGTVQAVSEYIKVADHSNQPSIWRVRLYNVMGDYQDFPGEQRVYAFTADRRDE